MPALYDSVRTLQGVGPTRVKQLDALGIHTLYDLLCHFPRDYEDRTHLVAIADLPEDHAVCFEAMVVSEPHTAHIRKGMDITKLKVADHTGQIPLTFFNQSYLADQLHYGESYVFYGRRDPAHPYGGVANPAFEALDGPHVVTRRILPIYALTAGISNRLMVKLIQQAADACLPALPELLPKAVRDAYHLLNAAEAYRQIHHPDSMEQLDAARHRLIFEEFFVFSAGLAILRSRRQTRVTIPFSCTDPTPFCTSLPFPLTGAQQRAIGEIAADLGREVPMNRLVQGDVGSGKTVIAAAAAYCAAKSGRQTAFMVPTEILAEQHAASLAPMMERFGIQTALLSGALSARQRRETEAAVANGQVQLIIGTHALLSESVQFADLGLVIADEQHRFGVAQRAALRAKGQCPHLLVMSATPIPRTLSLILYGDLDLSIVDERPPGRQPVDTFLVGEAMRARINAFIRKQATEGHQVFIVCPAIDPSETESVKSVEAWAETLQQSVFPDLRVLLLHGRMKAAEKEQVMSAFSAGKADILVSTTVIEVGVDVPNATLIVIENAERFGLSQLHQLRGRVGRGSAKSYCVLFSTVRNEETLSRLRALCKTDDGFAIAESDLSLRGPGDFLGQRQHGLPAFKVASLSADLHTLSLAQDACVQYLPTLSPADTAPLLERLQALFDGENLVFN
jgi:ATP-dependent DNA helicase RecG